MIALEGAKYFSDLVVRTVSAANNAVRTVSVLQDVVTVDVGDVGLGNLLLVSYRLEGVYGGAADSPMGFALLADPISTAAIDFAGTPTFSVDEEVGPGAPARAWSGTALFLVTTAGTLVLVMEASCVDDAFTIQIGRGAMRVTVLRAV